MEMVVKDGAAAVAAAVAAVPEQESATTGGNLRKARAQCAGTATVTGPALDAGASQAEPRAAATPG